MLNKKLREIRMSKGYTQQATADALDVTLTSYQRYEMGTREPSIQMINKIADLFDVSIDELFGRD